MLRRIASAISLTTIDGDAEIYHDPWTVEAQGLQVTANNATAATDTSLCSRCQAFDIQAFARTSSRRKGYLMRDVESSAEGGCTFCSLLRDAVKDVEKPEYFYTHAIKPGKTVTNPDLYVHMTVSESYREENRNAGSTGMRANRIMIELGDRFSGMRNMSGHEICLAADAGSAAALTDDVLGRYIGDDPSSDSHYDTAQSWIKGCSSHAKCNETVSGSIQIDPYHAPLPTRVIEVAQEDGQQRLYLRQTEGLRGAYITLTHRWNEHTGQCITTTSNYEQRILGGDFGPLPQLFRDAFLIAQKLNVKYIWIDSICIIQQGDDLADWRREAPNMAQYYQFSLFTLAGTAEDMSGGLMHPYSATTTPWTSHIARLPYRDKLGVVHGEFYAYKRRTALVDEYMSQVRSSILFRRGWILQEWLLSKRLLWYTPAGLFYECQEELPRAYDQAQIVYHRTSEDLRAHLQLKASFHHSNKDILGFWYHALEVYSGQHLTKPEMDRILAVAGLAKEVEPILARRKGVIGKRRGEEEEVYAAGLWLRDIHHGLLWEQEHTASPCTDKVDRVPSWSWASLMTPVRWPGKVSGTKPGFTITGLCFAQKKQHQVPDYVVQDGHHVRPSSHDIAPPHFDPTNMSACLHLRAKLHVVHIRGYLDTEDNLKRAALSTAYAPVPKTSNWRAVCSAFRPEIIAGWASMEQTAAQHPGMCDDYGVAVYAFVVSTRWLRHGLWVKMSEPVLDVLYVEEVEDRPGVFKRLGVGRIGDRALITEFDDVEPREVQLI